MQMFRRTTLRTGRPVSVHPVSKLLFFDTRFAWLWVIVRMYVGYQWLTSGLSKAAGYSIALGSFGPVKGGSWLVGGHGAIALKGFFAHSLSLAGGQSPAVQSWYAAFLQHVAMPGTGVFAYLIALGELFVGLGLIFGAFTGLAAFFGALMNMNYLLAGAVSINPVLFLLEIFLILAWRVCGYYGLDYFLLAPFRRSDDSLIVSSEPIVNSLSEAKGRQSQASTN